MNPPCLNANLDHKDDCRPVHIYYTHKTPQAEPELIEALSRASRKIIVANSWSELIGYLIGYNPVSICVNAKNFEGLTSLDEVLSMIKTFGQVTGKDIAVTITLGVNFDTPYKIVKEAQMSDTLGIVPNNTCFGWMETVRGIDAQFNGMTYWPKHIMDQLPGAKKPKPTSFDVINLTRRQQQIFDIVVSRGSSNKHIAKLLNLSESTVKLHIGAILKKHGLKNRTQLAVFSKKLDTD